MAEGDNSNLLMRRVYRNRHGARKIRRNLIEAVLETALVIGIIVSIPFVFNLKLALLMLCGSGVFIFNYIGYRNKSWTEVLERKMKQHFSKTSRKLKSPVDKRLAGKLVVSNQSAEFLEKTEEFMRDENLYRENAGMKEKVVRACKPYLINLRNNLGL